jgi:hypothetical protein
MKTKNLLFVALACGLVFGAYQVSRSKAPTLHVESTLLYPNLLEAINEAQSIEIANAAGQFSLARQGDGWGMADRDGFPVQTTAVRELLMQLAALKIREEKTAKPEQYATLGVEELDTPKASGLRVTVSDKSAAKLAALVVGKTRKTSGNESPGHYVRRTGEASALLVEGELGVKLKRNEWLDTAIANIPVDRVRQVSLVGNGEPPVVVAKAERKDQLFTLQQVPKDKEPKSAALVSNVGGLLLDLRFEDVASAKLVAGLTPERTATLETFDGLTATLESYAVDGRSLVAIRFAHHPVAEQAAPAEPVGGGAAKTEAAGAETPDVAKEVETLNERTRLWVYQLADYKSRTLKRSFADLVKVKEKAPPPATAD